MAAHELQASVRRTSEATLIDLTGELDSVGEQVLHDAWDQAVATGARRIVLNFTAVDYINSTGIALIVGVLARARTQGTQVSAFGLSDHYREIFEITRLADFMTIAHDESAAVDGADGRTHV